MSNKAIAELQAYHEVHGLATQAVTRFTRVVSRGNAVLPAWLITLRGEARAVEAQLAAAEERVRVCVRLEVCGHPGLSRGSPRIKGCGE